jgi:hypothetical protein
MVTDIVHGVPPERTLIKGQEYGHGSVLVFATKTFFHLLFKVGYRLENWPYEAPLPETLEAVNLKSPQLWQPVLIARCIRQYTHPDPVQQLHVVCHHNGKFTIQLTLLN